MNKKPIIYLDYGHGGLDMNGNYTTLNKKLYEFTEKNYTAYEGMMNRVAGTFILDELTSRNFEVKKVMDMIEDTPLSKRVNFANEDYVSRGRPPALFLSVHNDADTSSLKGQGGTASGTSIWTSLGETFSDTVATAIHTAYKIYIPERKFNTDYYRDGDPDKEADFTVLSKTLMPAVLNEICFFTNWKEVQLFYTPDFLPRIAKAIVHGIEIAYRVNK